MRRFRDRLTQALKPSAPPASTLVYSESDNLDQYRAAADHQQQRCRMRCSRSVYCVTDDSISELAERLEENGTIDEEEDQRFNGRNGYPVVANGKASMCFKKNQVLGRLAMEQQQHTATRHRLDYRSPVVQEGFPLDMNQSNGINGTSLSSTPAVTVKMRKKKSRRWTEKDIQKRLSLPANLRLPVSVVEKLNTTPILSQPLTRKSRRASLSEIGFGKLESYERLRQLGEGTYAKVYKGWSRLTGALVALKVIPLGQEEGAPCTGIREVSLLRELSHANVIILHDIIYTETALTLVFEYLDSDLKRYMDAYGNQLTMNNIRIFAFQIFRGLAYCHARRVLHRDLKPQNLLVNERGELKLADFGLARAKSVPTKTFSNEVVTLWYRPPELLLGSTDYSTHIDMWAVGCILYEMVCGRPFFPGHTVDEQLNLIFRALGTPRRSQHEDLVSKLEKCPYHFPLYRPEPFINHAPRLDATGLDLLHQLLQYDSRKRIAAAKAMHHPFFARLPKQVYHLDDSESIFTVPGVCLSHHQDQRNFSQQLKMRRQSIL